MTARSLVTPKLIARLAQLCGMFGSAHEGERANAAALADRLVRQLGLQWGDVLVPPPAEWQQIALVCRAHVHVLNDREGDFLDNIARLRKPPTDRQLDWLTAIYDRVQQETAA
jgi:hypothetical protein